MQSQIKLLILLLVLITTTIWLMVISYPDDKLHLIACDVGQGDAILITYKNTQILTDGGPNQKVIDCLGKYMPFWDRKIEVVILTNPDLDHYGGLIYVFKNYQVEKYIESPVPDSTQNFQVLRELVGSKRVITLHPTQGLSLVEGLMQLDIVYPDVSENYAFPSPQNNYSTVSILTFDSFKAILTGDIQEEASDYLAHNLSLGQVNYIKVPHHGSKHGMTSALLNSLKPEIAVISAGKNNRYGHPNPEILEMLSNLEIKTLRTDQIGDIEIVIRGNKIISP